MNKRIILKRFIKFLKEKEIYQYYIKALKKGSSYRIGVSYDTDPTQFIVNALEKPGNLINCAFAWSQSPKVDWFHFSVEWDKIVRTEFKRKV
jgi:hypothetical protein